MREPPRWLEALLRACVPDDSADAVLGDLREEYDVRSRRSRLGGAMWYAAQSVGIGAAYVRFRLNRRDGQGRRGRHDLALEPGDRPWRGRRGAGMDIWRVLVHAVRSLGRSPAFTAVSILTLAAGIGVNAGAFAIVDAIAFRPIPVPGSERLVALFGVQREERLLGFSYPDLKDYQDGSSGVFDAMGGFIDDAASLRVGDEATMVWLQLATPSYFEVLRPRLALGRLLGPDDETAVVLSEGLWRSRFDSDPEVVGRAIELNGHPFTVVGVVARGFQGTRLFSYAPELWVPVRAHAQIVPGSETWLDLRSNGWLSVVARLHEGVTMEQATAALNATAASLARSFPETHAGRTVRLLSNRTPINPFVFEASGLRSAGLATMLGVALVLIIACANVANLQLARGWARSREMAVRVALGGSRLRVMSVPFIESLLLGLAGGGLGLLVGRGFLRLSATLLPPMDFASAFDPRIDWRVVSFASLAALGSGILAGILPSLRASDVDAASALRVMGRGSRRSRLLEGLVVLQVAFSVVALVGAALLTRSFRNTQSIDPGFRLSDGLVLTVDPGLGGRSPAQVRDFYDRLLERVRDLPGVTGAARSSYLPLDGNWNGVDVAREGEDLQASGLSAIAYSVDPGFWTVLGVPVLEGREFNEADHAATDTTVLVNRTLAARLWPDGTALGRRISIDGTTARVIGVLADTKIAMLNEPARSVVALPLKGSSRTRTQTSLLIRTTGDPAALAPAVRRVVKDLDPSLALMGLKTLEDQAAYALTPTGSGARGSGLFGILALILTVAGLYGVLSYTVARRSQEIGIRMALGARGRRVTTMIVARGLGLAGVGIALGLVGAVALARLLSGMLYDVSPLDPLSIGGAVVVILGVSALASWLPALRAASVDPLAVIRAD